MGSLVVGTIYYGLMFILAGFFLLLALIFPKKAKGFFIAAGCIVVLFVIVIPLWARLSLKIMEIKERPMKEAAEKRYNEARAVFDEQCKKAGEKIYRTVDNVDGVILLKVWEENDTEDYWGKLNDPMWEYAADIGSSGKSYIGKFVHKYYKNTIGDIIEEMGYKYVDVPNGEQFTHYTGKYNGDNWWRDTSNEEIISKSSARYAVTFETDVNPELRKYWVAGVTFKIIDLQNNELLAEKTVFNFSKTLGKRMHGQSWTTDNMKCGIAGHKGGLDTYANRIAEFVFSVLKPQP